MQTFTSEQTPAEIVKAFPKASDLFKSRKINFCCSGDRPLEEVFIEMSIDKQEVLSELNTSFEQWKNSNQTSVNLESLTATELIEHIISTYHNDLSEELFALTSYVTRVYKVHGNDQSHLKDMYNLFNQLNVVLQGYIEKETETLFPLITKYEQTPNEKTLDEIHLTNKRLLTDIEHIEGLLYQIRESTSDYTLPDSACNTYRMTYARLLDLESKVQDYLHLEINILFKLY